MNFAAECLLAALGHEGLTEDLSEAEQESVWLRAMVGARLLAEAIGDLETIRTALVK